MRKVTVEAARKLENGELAVLLKGGVVLYLQFDDRTMKQFRFDKKGLLFWSFTRFVENLVNLTLDASSRGYVKA